MFFGVRGVVGFFSRFFFFSREVRGGSVSGRSSAVRVIRSRFVLFKGYGNDFFVGLFTEILL
ncbi:hypothetical protein BLW95_13840 [Lacticaseibacillus paracasei]|nr:hypothetical protein BLW95_13840 [Lacticaseibacillus paracasei]